MLWRAFRARHNMTSVVDRTHSLGPTDLVAVVVARNEAGRIPHFLKHYRKLGIAQFLVVDNDSDDASAQLWAEQPDVSLWQCPGSYRETRFGLDWAMRLLRRYCHQRWALTVDVDELLVYDGMERHDLPALTQLLTAQGRDVFGALMLDLYPKGALGSQTYDPESDPVQLLNWFDAGPYRAVRQAPMGNLWVQGGARERKFFEADPERGPTLNKIPLVRWHRDYAYVNSTHSALPPALNAAYDGPGTQQPSGVLLHTKFLPQIVSDSETEKQRKQHFGAPELMESYYDQVISAPNLWFEGSVQYQNPAQLQQLNLMSKLDW